MRYLIALSAAVALGVALLTPTVARAQDQPAYYGNVIQGRNQLVGPSVSPNAFVPGQNYTYSGADGRVYSLYIPGHTANLENRPLSIVPAYPMNSQNHQLPRNVYYYVGRYR